MQSVLSKWPFNVVKGGTKLYFVIKPKLSFGFEYNTRLISFSKTRNYYRNWVILS